MHHGSGDLQRGVAFILHTVHVLDGIPGQRVDEDPGGVGVGHVLHLHGKQRHHKKSPAFSHDHQYSCTGSETTAFC